MVNKKKGKAKKVSPQKAKKSAAKKVIRKVGKKSAVKMGKIAIGKVKVTKQVPARVMIDWEKNQQLLLTGARAAFREFLAAHSSEQLCAVGFLFELGNVSAQFDACAHVAKDRKEHQDQKVDVRWNSGSFTHPAGLTSRPAELGESWDAEVERLHDMPFDDDGDEDGEKTKEVYDGLIRISCEVLAALAFAGEFGDWRHVDFNVAEVNDSIDMVQHRDRLIRSRIMPASQ
jgi:hypothetical protein